MPRVLSLGAVGWFPTFTSASLTVSLELRPFISEECASSSGLPGPPHSLFRRLMCFCCRSNPHREFLSRSELVATSRLTWPHKRIVLLQDGLRKEAPPTSYIKCVSSAGRVRELRNKMLWSRSPGSRIPVFITNLAHLDIIIFERNNQGQDFL